MFSQCREYRCYIICLHTHDIQYNMSFALNWSAFAWSSQVNSNKFQHILHVMKQGILNNLNA